MRDNFLEQFLKNGIVSPTTCTICHFCGQKSNARFVLKECKNKMMLCGECLDNLTDNMDSKHFLFICPCCDTKITEFTI